MPGSASSGTNGSAFSLLLVDGEDQHRDALKSLCRAGGFQVKAAKSSREARRLAAAGHVDAAIVDCELEDEDALVLIRSLATSSTPIVFALSRKADLDLAEQAYGEGAADFSVKPAGPELPARLRHAIIVARGGRATPRLVLNRQERTCELDGVTYHLTRHERDFLACLYDAPGHFATYDQLIASIWGEGKAVETQYLRVLAAQVRRKLHANPSNAPLIHTVVGEGLKLNI